MDCGIAEKAIGAHTEEKMLADIGIGTEIWEDLILGAYACL